MALTFQFDKPTAIRVAEFLAQSGMHQAAAHVWWNLCADDPYDSDARRRLGDSYFEQRQAEYPSGSVGRSQFILQVISYSLPTPKLTAAYFDNLEALLQTRPKRTEPGDVVLGVGAGRCGSATLTAALAALPEACATHENPPLLFWTPLEEQLQFHVDRFRMLAEYHSVVFDVSPPWLQGLERYFAEFPRAKAVGLYRDHAACVRSYVGIQGKGRESTNPWAPRRNGIWWTSPVDPSYPSYEVRAGLAHDPDAAKAAAIERFVAEYNQLLRARAEAWPGRLILVGTEELNNAEAQSRLASFLGLPLRWPRPQNVGNTADSRQHKLNREF